MIKKLVIILLFLLNNILAVYSQSNLTINNKSSSKSFNLFYTDLFGDDFTLSIQPDSTSKININNAELLNHPSEQYQVPFLVFPEDNIVVQPDSVFVENNPQRTAELCFFKAFMKKFGSLTYFDLPGKPYSTYPKQSIAQLIAKRDIHLQQELQKETNFLEDYLKKHHTSNEFKEYCQVYFEYGKILKTLQLPIKDKKLSGLLDKTYLEELFNYKSKFTSEKYLNNIIYRIAMRYYAVFVDLYFPNTPIEKLFSGNNYQYILFNNIKSKFNINTVTKDDIETYYKKSNNIQFTDYIKNLESAVVAIKNNKEVDLFQSNTSEGKVYSSIVNSHKGKVILVDFWASWCAPCLYEIPFLQKLEEELKTKDFEVIHILMDTNKNLWEKASNIYNIDNNNFLLLNNFKSSLAKNLKLKTIPRYVLIDKKGNVVSYDAERPSTIEGKKIIYNLINER